MEEENRLHDERRVQEKRAYQEQKELSAVSTSIAN